MYALYGPRWWGPITFEHLTVTFKTITYSTIMDSQDIKNLSLVMTQV